MPVLRIAATYIGTVIGAGFASGQEILRFFAAFGHWGYAGIGLAACLFILLGLAAMELGRSLKAASYNELLNHAVGHRLGRLMDLVVTLFLASSVAVMISGSGALFEQQFGISPLAGSALLAAASVITVMHGLRGITTANLVIVPGMVVLILFLAAASIEYQGLGWLRIPDRTLPDLQAAPNWLLSALLYVSYNLILALAVLAPLGRQAKGRSALIIGSLLGGGVLGLLALAIKTALVLHLEQVTRAEIPMLYVAGFETPALRLAYVALLWAEIYSTAISGLFGLTSRLRESIGLPPAATVWVVAAAAFLGSFSNFGALIGLLYPLFGYLGLILIAALLRALVGLWFARR